MSGPEELNQPHGQFLEPGGKRVIVPAAALITNAKGIITGMIPEPNSNLLDGSQLEVIVDPVRENSGDDPDLEL